MAYTSQYPPEQSATYVNANNFGADWYQWFATDPTNSLIGNWAGHSWCGAASSNQRFHIDLGEAKIIKRLYYENSHSSGAYTVQGVKDFIIQGSNSATAFAQLTYGTDTDWDTLTTDINTFVQHAAVDASDPHYVLITNSTAYRYYAIKCANTFGSPEYYMRIRRFELQTEDGSAVIGPFPTHLNI